MLGRLLQVMGVLTRIRSRATAIADYGGVRIDLIYFAAAAVAAAEEHGRRCVWRLQLLRVQKHKGIGAYL
jgi:hypothetical protein